MIVNLPKNLAYTAMKKLISLVLSLASMTAFAAALPKTFMVLSDIHFDPLYQCEQSTSTTCTIAQKLNKATASEWPAIFAQYGSKTKSGPGQDTNYALLTSSLNEAKSDATNNGIAFVALGGDFLGHHLQSNYATYLNDTSQKDYQAFVYKTFQFLTSEITKYFPNKTIIPVLGNNDSYNGDYYINPNGAFFRDMSNLWAPWFKDTTNQQNFKAEFSGTAPGEDGGYYAINMNPDLKIVVLESGYFSTRLTQPSNTADGAKDMLAWLQKTLTAAQSNHQNVWIMMHIPNGIDTYDSKAGAPVLFWNSADNQSFLDKVRKYNNIRMIFLSHTHNDSVRMITNGSKTAPKMLIPEVFTPSISPVHANAPAFKIYAYDPASGKVIDDTTYHLFKGKWQFEYSFTNAYQTDSVSDGIQKLLINKDLLTNSTYQNRYANYYAAGAPSGINSSNIIKYYCGAAAQDFASYKSCMSS